MPASISSTFIIEYNQAAGQGTFTIANPGRAFTVLSVLCTGLNTSAITCRKNTGGGATFATSTLATNDLNDFPSTMTIADATLTASDNIHITIATANATQVKFLCIANDAEALTVS